MFEPFKLIGPPGSRGFLALCCILGVFLGCVWPRRPGVVRVWLSAVSVTYLVFGTPVVANEVADALSAYHAFRDLTHLQASDTIVVLGGDNVRGRIVETVRAHASWSEARIVIFGDDWLRDQLIGSGIPVSRIDQDPRPGNTFEQMAAVRDRFKNNASPIAIVASRLQMPRVAALADAMKLHVTLLPSPADEEPPRTGPARWMPRYTALRITRDALYEHAALAYYRWRGLIDNGRNAWDR